MSILNNIPPSVGLHDPVKGAPKPHDTHHTSGISFADLLDQIVVTPSFDTTPKEQPVHNVQQAKHTTQTMHTTQTISHDETPKVVDVSRAEVKKDAIIDEFMVLDYNISNDDPQETSDILTIAAKQPHLIEQKKFSSKAIEEEIQAPAIIEDGDEASYTVPIAMASTSAAYQAETTSHITIPQHQDKHKEAEDMTVQIIPMQVAQVGQPPKEEDTTQSPVSFTPAKNVNPTEAPQHIHEIVEAAPLPRNLVELIRGGYGEQDQPIASVEVRYPEETIMRVQLPLSVMMHEQPHGVAAPTNPAPIAPVMVPTFAHMGGSFHQETPEQGQPNNNSITLQGIHTGKTGGPRGERPQPSTQHDKAIVQEMVDRIRNLMKEQRQDVRVVLDHATYGPMTMNLTFSQNNKRVNAVFMSDNEDLLRLLQQHNDDINGVFQEAGVVCQQQHVRRV